MRFILASLLLLTTYTNAARVQYAYNNSEQQYRLKNAIMEMVTYESNKCLATANLSGFSESFLNLNRSLDYNIVITKKDKMVRVLQGNVEYSTFADLQLKFINIVKSECQ